MAKSKAPKPPKVPMSPAKKKKLYWAGGLSFFALIIAMAMVPAQGSIRYGICKVYIELNELYPEQIKYLSVEDGDPVKVFYKKVDPFGVSSVNSMECYFKRDNTGNFLNEISKIDINGKYSKYEAEKPENIKKFNTGIGAIIANPPDLSIPSFSQNDISRYKESEEE